MIWIPKTYRLARFKDYKRSLPTKSVSIFRKKIFFYRKKKKRVREFKREPWFRDIAKATRRSRITFVKRSQLLKKAKPAHGNFKNIKFKFKDLIFFKKKKNKKKKILPLHKSIEDCFLLKIILYVCY